MDCSTEILAPAFKECDLATSLLDSIPGRNCHRPSLLTRYSYEALKDVHLRRANNKPNACLAPKKHFCCFVYTNPECMTRNTFFNMLSKYKPVHAPGQLFNNAQGVVPGSTPNWRVSVIDYTRDFKFAIAFENQSVAHYVSEKMLNALQAGALPIYWGAPNIADYINPKAFINCHDFTSFEEVLAHVKKVDQDEALYRSYMNAPILKQDSSIHKWSDLEQQILDAVEELIDRSPLHLSAHSDSFFQRFASNLPRQLPNSRRHHTKQLSMRYGQSACRIPVYILSTPTRRKRHLLLSQRLTALGVSHKIYMGVDSEHDDMSLYRARVRDSHSLLRTRGYPLTDHEIACYASHYHLWWEIYHRKHAFAIVLEDDAQVDDDFYSVAQLLPHIGWSWDVVRLSMNNLRAAGKTLCHIGGGRYLKRMRRPGSDTVGMVVSAKAVERFIKGDLWYIRQPIDTAFEQWWQLNLRFLCIDKPPVNQLKGEQDPSHVKRKQSRGNLSFTDRMYCGGLAWIRRLRICFWEMTH